MKKVSVVNAKGGVGKTTSSVNFACILGEQGHRVLVVDMDPQSNATKTLVDPTQDIPYHIGQLLLKQEGLTVRDVILSTPHKGVDILPASRALRTAETFLLIETTSSGQRRLQSILAELENDYDYCIIDCPPQMNITVVNALVASDTVIVPVKMDMYALDGIQELTDKIKEVRENFNPNLVFQGCFLTMDEHTVVNRETKELLAEMIDGLVFENSIRRNVKVVESTFKRIPVNVYKRYCYASMDYRKLTKEIFG